jgi:DNA polymerase-3 subunit alpha
MKYFNCHNHTDFSNLRLLDCIIKPKDLIDKAIELGLSGVAITDHECLCAHMSVNQYAKKLQETNPDFKIALGNEIYLTDTRDSGQKYYHFILIAKDKIGYRALKELSSIAWYNLYMDRGLERVPLLKSELKDVMKQYKGHVIATTACLGGELSTHILNQLNASEVNDLATVNFYEKKINNFLNFCIDVFGKDDFYIECAPANNEEQIKVNKELLSRAAQYELKLTLGTDSHYLSSHNRYVHKAYLNSKGGEREVDSFYEFSRLMDIDEVRELLGLSFSEIQIQQIILNSQTIYDKIEFFSLEKNQAITEVDVTNYPKTIYQNSNYPILQSLFASDNKQERYWVNECFIALKEKQLLEKTEYIARLEEEARVKRIIGEKLGTCMFAYPNTLKHYIDLMWECGSTVGAGRGSSCAALNHYLLGITQLDPIEWSLPFWRYLNDERVELGDVDIDLAPSKLQKIFSSIREERGELGLVQVCTFGTEGTKSMILTACRGYRSEEYPNGIDNDEAQYISSLVPQERGFLWTLKDLVEGNEEKGRKPQKNFLSAVNQYPGLLDIMKGIEGLVCRRGSHASGIILFDSNIYDTAAIMRTPSGAIVTQWDLHAQEAAGSVKYDFLLTSVQDIIIQTIDLLQKDNIIDSKLTLREVYNKYLHPSILPQDDKKMWNALANNEVIGCFQFDSTVGAQAAKKIHPSNPLEMSDANGLMRLMTGEPGGENPIDKYVRFKNNIQLWYKEMRDFGLTIEEQKSLEPYFLQSYGVPPSQEQLMMMLMDENICNFSLADANMARKVVGKKLMDKIPMLKEKIITQASSPLLGQYVWKYGAGPQMGYSFSIIHALAYSFVGMQTLYLATNFNPVYWNTAYLIVNSGSLDTNKDESTDYIKIAKAIGAIKEANIKVSLPDINKSDFGFLPDTDNNQILFGLKGLSFVGDDVVNEIIKNRPYHSIKDFCNKTNIKKQSMISLIKGGAFDTIEKDRKFTMAWYLWNTCDKKKRITLQNMNGLMSRDLIPETEDFILPKRIYEFTRYLKACCKLNSTHYILDERAINFILELGLEYMFIFDDNQNSLMKITDWDKVYQNYMNIFREWMKENQFDILKSLNDEIFKEEWNKYAKGTVSAWEMEALCFYYHEHELQHINMEKYGLVDFNSLLEEPQIDRTFKKNGKDINLYKLYKICGTCIAKNKTKSSVTLLTPSGVVEVKFRKEYFALFDKRISKKQPDGSKKIVEKSWFDRGSMILVQGIRRGDGFVTKKYASSGGHQLYKIDKIFDNGDIILRNIRAQGDEEEEDV